MGLLRLARETEGWENEKTKLLLSPFMIFHFCAGLFQPHFFKVRSQKKGRKLVIFFL